MPDALLPVRGCENDHRLGDVVFVHGLNGNARDYWCFKGQRENYWPAWLGEELPSIGVWSLNYENAAFKSRKLTFLGRSGYRGFAMPLWDRAKSVLLQLEVAGIGGRPLVFVTHSMGGLLIKQLLSSAHENAAQAPWRAILQNTRGVCFIATPHIGSDLARWASYFQTLLGTNVSIEELRPHDPLLRQLNESYLNLVTRKGAHIKTLTFYETKPLFGGTLVVAEGDANPNVPRAGLYALGEDHASICKPPSKSAAIHRKLVDFLRNECFQIPQAPPPPTGETTSPADTPWPPDPGAVRKARKRVMAVSLLGAGAVVCVALLLLAARRFGLLNGRGEAPDRGVPPVASEKGKNQPGDPAPDMTKNTPLATAGSDARIVTPPELGPVVPRARVTGTGISTGKPSSDWNNPAPITLGAVVHGRVDPMSATAKAHFWVFDLPAGNYKAVVDMERGDRAFANIVAGLHLLGIDGTEQNLLGSFNDIEFRARHIFAFVLEAPRKGIIGVESSMAMMDYDLGLFESTAAVTVPFFRDPPPVTPIRLQDAFNSGPLDGGSAKTSSAYCSLTLAAGDYNVIVDLRRLDGMSANLIGAVSMLNADGEFTASIGEFNEIKSEAARSFRLPLSDDRFVILRIAGNQDRAILKVEPRRD